MGAWVGVCGRVCGDTCCAICHSDVYAVCIMTHEYLCIRQYSDMYAVYVMTHEYVCISHYINTVQTMFTNSRCTSDYRC